MNTLKTSTIVLILWSLMMPGVVMAEYNFSLTYFENDTTKVMVTTFNDDETGELNGHFLVMSFKGDNDESHSVMVACDPQTRRNLFSVKTAGLMQSQEAYGDIELKVDTREAHFFKSVSTGKDIFSQSVAMGNGLQFHLIIHELANGDKLKVKSTSDDSSTQFDVELLGLKPAIADFLQRCDMTI